MQSQQRYQQAKRITIIGALANCLLGMVKVIIGLVGHSQALLADGVHSFSDLLTDLMVLIAAKASSRGPDHNHPYGHARIETLASTLLAVLLIAIGIIIASDAIYQLISHHHYYLPSIAVIIAALLSVVVNEILYRLTHLVGLRIHSILLQSNAWHHRIDALTSAIVLIGVIGARLGWPWLDNIAAIVVALFIIKIAVTMVWSSAKELVDTGLAPDTIEKITEKILQVAGVESIHQLRTRMLAGNVIIDVHIQVNSWLSVSEGHYIGDQVHYRLLKSDFGIADVLVHVDPEDDEGVVYHQSLPNRSQIEQLLANRCKKLPGYKDIKKINFHYLAGKLYVELFLPLSLLQTYSTHDLLTAYHQAINSIDDIAKLELYYF